MANFTIYHNPRCSKSRQTLALLKNKGVSLEVVEYLKEVPSANKLDAIGEKLGKVPLEWTRTGESVFKALGLSKKDKRSHGDWLQILAGNPILIERPIVVSGGKAVLGRPPENVLELF